MLHLLWNNCKWEEIKLNDTSCEGDVRQTVTRSNQPGHSPNKHRQADKTCGRTDRNGKKYAQHHIQGQNDQYLGQQFEKNEVVLGRAHQPSKIWQGRPAKRWRDDMETYRRDTIWQRTGQDRLTWRWHAEACTQPLDTTAAQWWKFNDDDISSVFLAIWHQKWSHPFRHMPPASSSVLTSAGNSSRSIAMTIAPAVDSIP